jgi:hypothetical protein
MGARKSTGDRAGKSARAGTEAPIGLVKTRRLGILTKSQIDARGG